MVPKREIAVAQVPTTAGTQAGIEVAVLKGHRLLNFSLPIGHVPLREQPLMGYATGVFYWIIRNKPNHPIGNIATIKGVPSRLDTIR